MDDLRNSPQIAELLEILDRNGLTKEKDEVNSLVDYIGSMETTLSAMMNELTEMRQEVRHIHDNTLRAKCQQMLDKTTEKVKSAFDVVKTTKDNLIRGAENAIKEFKLKGKDALITAVEKMRIPKAIEALQNCFAKLSLNMDHNASRMDAFRSEISEAGVHIKKAGLTLFGKTSKEVKKKEADKGILAKLGKMYKGLSERFANMSEKSKAMVEKLQDKKESVKADLAAFKQTVAKEKSAPQKEKTR